MIKFNNQKGFSLIELMVALAVSAIVMVAVYNFFTIQLNSFASQQQVVQTQLNSKAFVRYMKEIIENAGTAVPSNVTNTSPLNHLNKVSDPNGYYLKGTDVLQVMRGGNSTISFTYDNLSGAGLTFAESPTIPFDLTNGGKRYIGDLLVLQGDKSKNTALASITAISLTTIEFSSIDTTWGQIFVNSNVGSLSNSGIAYLVPQDTNSIQTFFVEDSDQDGVGTLRVVNGYFNINNIKDASNESALPILTGVEDLQVDFLIDGDGDGYSDATQASLVDPASWNENPGLTLTNAQVVRIRLLVRSQRGDKNTVVERPNITADGPHNYYNYTTDRMKQFRRRMYTVTAELRNK